MKNGIDYSYIKAIIFPELFSSDIPQPLSNLSYSRFSDRSNNLMNTGIKGSGAWSFFPKTNNGPCFFYKPATATAPNPFPMTMSNTCLLDKSW